MIQFKKLAECIPRYVAFTPNVVKIGAIGMLLGGCSTIQEKNEMEACPEPSEVLTEATVDSSQDDYSEFTDPAVLAAQTLKNAQDDLETSENNIYINRITGIGVVACLAENNQIFLTVEGTKISQDMRPR